MTDDSDIRRLWQSQKMEQAPMSIAELRERAQIFNARWRWSFNAEYAACAFTIAAFGAVAWIAPGWMIKAGSGLVILATVFVIAQLRRRAPRRVPDPELGVSIYDFHRAELVRARDTLGSAWAWYIGPFIPGIALIFLGRFVQFHAPGRSIGADHLIVGLAAMLVAIVFVSIAAFNLARARGLQRKIDEVDAWRTGREH
jgi:hypothetical protein